MSEVAAILKDGTEISWKDIKHISDQIRGNEQGDYKWDINFAEGIESEHFIRKLIKTAEIKTDYKAVKYGNVFVEYMCSDKPSGISKTESNYYGFVLVDECGERNSIIFVKTSVLKMMCKKYYGDKSRDKIGGDRNAVRGIALPLSDLLNPEFIFRNKIEGEHEQKYNQPMKRIVDGKDEIQYEYVCKTCKAKIKSVHKNFFSFCPGCRIDGRLEKLEMSY